MANQTPKIQLFIDQAKQSGYSDKDIHDYINQKLSGSSQLPTPPVSQPSNTPSPVTPPPPSVGQFASNVLTSGEKFIGDIGNAIFHPVQTSRTLGSLPLGLGEKIGRKIGDKILPGPPAPVLPSEQTLNRVLDQYKQRYGSIDAAKKTIYNDPVGFLADVSVALGGTGEGAKLVGEAGNLSTVSKAGEIASKAGELTNPITAATKGIGKTAQFATEGRTIPSPIGGSFQKDLAQIAQQRGVTLPASSLSKSPAVSILEAASARGLFGGKLQQLVDNAAQQINDLANKTVDATKATPDLKNTGNLIVNNMNRFKDEFIKTKNQLYQAAELPNKPLGGKSGTNVAAIPIDTSKTLAFVDKVLADKQQASIITGSAEGTPFLQNIRNGLSLGQNLTARDARLALQEINNKIKNFNEPISQGYRATLKKIGASLSDDLDNAIATHRPDLGEALVKANQFYQQGIDKLNSNIGKNIAKFQNNPEKIVDSVVRPNSQNDIARLYDIVGPDVVPHIQASFLEKIFNQARNPEGLLSGPKLSMQIKRYGEPTLKATLTEDQYSALKDVEKLSNALTKGQFVARGSQTGFVLKSLGEVYKLFTNPGLGLKLFLIDKAISYGIPSRLGQQIMTTGVPLSGTVGKSLQKLAPKAGTITPAILQKRAQEEQSIP